MKQVPEFSPDLVDCPIDANAVNEYLDREDAERQPDSLTFYFRVQLDGRTLWVWKYSDGSQELNYAVVRRDHAAERPENYEIGCGPSSRSDETPLEVVATLIKAGF